MAYKMFNMSEKGLLEGNGYKFLELHFLSS